MLTCTPGHACTVKVTNIPPRKMEMPPRGAFCTHRRMRFVRCMKYPSYVRCDVCTDKTRRPCTVECPDCGLNYCFFDGTGYL